MLKESFAFNSHYLQTVRGRVVDPFGGLGGIKEMMRQVHALQLKKETSPTKRVIVEDAEGLPTKKKNEIEEKVAYDTARLNYETARINNQNVRSTAPSTSGPFS